MSRVDAKSRVTNSYLAPVVIESGERKAERHGDAIWATGVQSDIVERNRLEGLPDGGAIESHAYVVGVNPLLAVPS